MADYRLGDLLDMVTVQRMADAHYRAAGMPIGIIDTMDGSVLVGSGWQDICVKYHRENPISLARCQQSDKHIQNNLVEGEACQYKCQNGLWDIGMPIIVAGRHLATVFLGQFFYEGEVPQRRFFVRQALELGVNVDDYMAALDSVPVFSREKVADTMAWNLALVSFLADLAERALAKLAVDEQVRRLTTDLERRVVERTAELSLANQELEAFVYSVSHDLRTPLRAIDGFSQMIIEDAASKLTATDVQHLGQVRAAAQRMAQLIDQLLELARSSRRELRLEHLDMSALATSISEELRAAHPERDVEVVVRPGLVAPADALLLRIILTNLIGNAWKFTSKHEKAHIEIGGGVEMAGDAHEKVFFVRDDGAGFDSDHAERLFGAFQRLHPTDEYEGDGIGLATVQRLVHRHGGRVWAEAEVEKGATFYFALPEADHCPG